MYIKRQALLLALALGAILTAGLASVASGAGAANGPLRASEYPLAVVSTSTVPKRPKAGKSFSAAIGIVNQETGEPLQSGRVACPARIGHRGVRMFAKWFDYARGVAGCMWDIPAGSGRKHMVAKVGVYSDEGTVSSRFRRVVRP